MSDIRVEYFDASYMRVICDDMGIEAELSEYFTFEVPGAKFHPKVKARIWDGKIRLLDPIRKKLYTGLLPYVHKFAKARDYTVEVEWINHNPEGPITTKEVEEFVERLNLPEHIEPYDYQIEAVRLHLDEMRNMVISPTGSGKSLIIYLIARWHIACGRKVIVVVPTTALVEQMYADFRDYSEMNGWDVTKHCQKLYTGFSKVFESDLLFTTWQSAYTQKPSWLCQFDAIVGDEAHTFKAKCLTGMMEAMTSVRYRIGTTGSLDNKKVHKLVLEGLFGTVTRMATTAQLQAEGKLSDLRIRGLILKHSPETRKLMTVTEKTDSGFRKRKANYQEEMDVLVRHEKRNKFIRNLALSCKGNTLVLFQFVEKHGKPLYEMIKEKAGDRNVYYIDKDVKPAERERIRKALAQDDNAIVVASFGTTATGINAPSLSNLIFASPTKSLIRVLQSIGRILRLNKGKEYCTLYDITDEIKVGPWSNHTLKHGAERYKIYSDEQFPVKMIEVDL